MLRMFCLILESSILISKLEIRILCKCESRCCFALFQIVTNSAFTKLASAMTTAPSYSMLVRIIMMTSSNGKIFRVTGHLCGEFTGPSEFPAQRPVTRSFDVFFDLRLNKRLSKQSWGWWFETLSRPLWRHCNDEPKLYYTCTLNTIRYKKKSRTKWVTQSV